MKRFYKYILIASLALFMTGCSKGSGANMDKSAIVKTDKGEFTIELDLGAAPKTVENFIQKSQKGEYNGRVFHRVEDWVVQGGDPDGNGTGGGNQETELSDRNFVEGAVGVARGGDIKVSNADQFFICTTECSFLNKQYTYFGKVTAGMDVVKKMQIGDKIQGIEIK